MDVLSFKDSATNLSSLYSLLVLPPSPQVKLVYGPRMGIKVFPLVIWSCNVLNLGGAFLYLVMIVLRSEKNFIKFGQLIMKCLS